MKRRLWKFCQPYSLLMVLSMIPSVTGHAMSITVSPIRVEHNVPPGGSITEAITISNDDTSPAHIRVRVEDWSLSQDGAITFAKAGSQPYSASPWIRVNPREFALAPGQSQEVRYSLSVPKDATPGGYRAAIIVANIPPPSPGEKQRRVMLEGRIATILYETVGRPVPSGEITGLSFKMGPEGKATFTISFENTGQVHIRTRGEITIRDRAGKEVLKAPLPDFPILPQSRRDFTIAVKEDLPAGEYVAELIMDIGRKELLAGERRFSVRQ